MSNSTRKLLEPTQVAPTTLSPQMAATVYLIAQPSLKADGSQPNLSPLNEHGRIQVLVETGERPSKYPERCLRVIRRRLKHFNPATDFLCWAGGDTLAAVLTGHVLSDLSYEHGWNTFRWLVYQRVKDEKTGRWTEEGAYYVPREVPFMLPEDEDDDHDEQSFSISDDDDGE